MQRLYIDEAHMALDIFRFAVFLGSMLPQYMATYGAEYVQRRVCFVNVQSSLHENVVFSVSARMCNAAYVIFIMWNSISGLDTCYHFRLNISCGVAGTGK